MAGPQSPWAPGKERVLWGHNQGGLTRRIGIDPQGMALESSLSPALLAGGHDRLPWPKAGRFWEHQWRGVLEGMRLLPNPARCHQDIRDVGDDIGREHGDPSKVHDNTSIPSRRTMVSQSIA